MALCISGILESQTFLAAVTRRNILVCSSGRCRTTCSPGVTGSGGPRAQAAGSLFLSSPSLQYRRSCCSQPSRSTRSRGSHEASYGGDNASSFSASSFFSVSFFFFFLLVAHVVTHNLPVHVRLGHHVQLALTLAREHGLFSLAEVLTGVFLLEEVVR